MVIQGVATECEKHKVASLLIVERRGFQNDRDNRSYVLERLPCVFHIKTLVLYIIYILTYMVVYYIEYIAYQIYSNTNKPLCL
jgi:hypothetical protein